jgi:hypothetical protein
VLKDLPQGISNLKSILANLYKHYVYIESGVYNEWCIKNSNNNYHVHRRVLEFDENLFFDENFLKKRFIRLLLELEDDFYLSNIFLSKNKTCHT